MQHLSFELVEEAAAPHMAQAVHHVTHSAVLQVPRTAHNFIALCQKGYYNGVSFHRLIPAFMV